MQTKTIPATLNNVFKGTTTLVLVI